MSTQSCKILRTMQTQFSAGGRVEVDAENKPQSIFRFLNFSDLMIRATFVSQNVNVVDYLNWELLNLANKQCELVCQGILLRGAVCMAQIYVDERIIFGPALVNAYLLEKSVAVFPRIVIDDELMTLAKNSSGSPMKMRGALWTEYLTRGEDGFYFVDYLTGTFYDRVVYARKGAMTGEGTLQAHKAVVLKKLDELGGSDNRRRAKAWWLMHYHNSAIERIRSWRDPDSETKQSLVEALIDKPLFPWKNPY